MDSDQVATFLQEHPEFFEQYADLLAGIYLPHPHGGRAIPISERQIVTLREKCRKLEAKLKELIEFGEENDAISEKLHRMTVTMMGTAQIELLLASIYVGLRDDFAVPHVALRMWDVPTAPERAEFDAVSAESRSFAQSLSQPYCSVRPMLDTLAWFGKVGEHLRSFAYVPLRSDQAFGLLAMASEDARRFYPEMGTLYLKRLGEVIGAALLRTTGRA